MPYSTNAKRHSAVPCCFLCEDERALTELSVLEVLKETASTLLILQDFTLFCSHPKTEPRLFLLPLNRSLHTVSAKFFNGPLKL